MIHNRSIIWIFGICLRQVVVRVICIRKSLILRLVISDILRSRHLARVYVWWVLETVGVLQATGILHISRRWQLWRGECYRRGGCATEAQMIAVRSCRLDRDRYRYWGWGRWSRLLIACWCVATLLLKVVLLYGWSTSSTIRRMRIHATIADRPRSVWNVLWCSKSIWLSINFFIVLALVSLVRLVPTPHADVTTYANSTSLLSHGSAKRCALREAWELLCAKDSKGCGLHFQAEMDMSSWRHRVTAQELVPRLRTPFRWLDVEIFGLFQFLEETKAQPVHSLVTH